MLYEAFINLNRQQKNTFNFQRPYGSLDKVCELTASSEGLLKYPGPIFAWRRTAFVLFLFLVEEIATKLNHIFVVLRRMEMFTPI